MGRCRRLGVGSAFARALPHLRDATQAKCCSQQNSCLSYKSSTDRMTPEQKKANLRMALSLASVAVVFFIGIFVKMVLLSH